MYQSLGKTRGWVVACWFLVLAVGTGFTPAAASGAEVIANADDYFPDTVGSRWRYRGEMVEGPLQKITTKQFVNVSTVMGTETIKGVTVKVFHDTNPGNHGPSNSYYRRDAAGIVYYGSEPGTALEKQLIPYQIVQFPLAFPTSFQQFDRKGLEFDADVDGDDVVERTDVVASVTVVAKEPVSVPAGTYQDAVRIEARMTLKIHLSSAKRTVVGTDTMTAWFARGVGLVKYVERQELPPFKSDQGWTSEITEELEEVEIKATPASLSRSEPATEGVLTDHVRDHELLQVVLASGFGADSGQPMTSEGLPTH